MTQTFTPQPCLFKDNVFHHMIIDFTEKRQSVEKNGFATISNLVAMPFFSNY